MHLLQFTNQSVTSAPQIKAFASESESFKTNENQHFGPERSSMLEVILFSTREIHELSSKKKTESNPCTATHRKSQINLPQATSKYLQTSCLCLPWKWFWLSEKSALPASPKTRTDHVVKPWPCGMKGLSQIQLSIHQWKFDCISISRMRWSLTRAQ